VESFLWPPQILASMRRQLLALKEAWHKSGDCLAPACHERAMHFPPSRYCKFHTS